MMGVKLLLVLVSQVSFLRCTLIAELLCAHKLIEHLAVGHVSPGVVDRFELMRFFRVDYRRAASVADLGIICVTNFVQCFEHCARWSSNNASALCGGKWSAC